MESARRRFSPVRVMREHSVATALVLWAACIAAIFPLSQRRLPFDRPLLAQMSFRAQVVVQVVQPIFPLILIGVTYLLTRRRAVLRAEVLIRACYGKVMA